MADAVFIKCRLEAGGNQFIANAILHGVLYYFLNRLGSLSLWVGYKTIWGFMKSKNCTPTNPPIEHLEPQIKPPAYDSLDSALLEKDPAFYTPEEKSLYRRSMIEKGRMK